MIDYAQIQNDASNAIAEAGLKSVIVECKTESDPVLRSDSISFTDSSTTFMVRVPKSQSVSSAFENITLPDSLRKQALYLLASSKGIAFKVETDHLVIFNGSYYDIKSLAEVVPSTTSLIFYFLLTPSTKDVSIIKNLQLSDPDALSAAIKNLT